MADDKVALKIEIEADRAKMSLGELESGFAGLQEKLKAQERVTDEGKAAFKRLSTEMANTSKEIKNIELGFEGLDKEQVASELGSVAGAVGDVTASLVLMGGESETLEQIAASIEKALAISMGMKGAIEGMSSARKLWNNKIKTSNILIKANAVVTSIAAGVMKIFKTSVDTTSKSFKTLKTAIASTGIGLLVVGVAALVANFGKIKDAINGVSAASKDLLEATKLNKEANEDNVEAINNSNNLLRQQGYTEREIINMKIKANKKNLESQIAEFEATKLINKEKLEGSKRNQEMLQNTLEILFIIPRTILKLVDLVTKQFADMINDITQDPIMKRVLGLEPVNFDFGIAEGADELLDQATRFIFDPDAVEEAGKAEQKALEDNLLKQKDAIAGHELALLDLDKKARADSKKVAEDADKKAFEERSKRRDIELIETKEFNEEMYKEEEEKTYNTLAFLQLLIDKEAEAHQKELDRIEAERQARLAANQERLESASQIIGAVGSLNNAALATDLKNAGDNEKLKEKLRKASFEREKKLNIAMALVNGAQAQMSILAQTPKVDFGIATAIAMAAAAVTTIAQIAAIKATTYQGGGSPAASESASAPSAGGAGDAGGGVQLSPVSNTSTILGSQQVYVTETDITNTQNNVSVIEESATF